MAGKGHARHTAKEVCAPTLKWFRFGFSQAQFFLDLQREESEFLNTLTAGPAEDLVPDTWPSRGGDSKPLFYSTLGCSQAPPLFGQEHRS